MTAALILQPTRYLKIFLIRTALPNKLVAVRHFVTTIIFQSVAGLLLLQTKLFATTTASLWLQDQSVRPISGLFTCEWFYYRG